MNKTILMGIGMMVGGIFFTVLGIYLMVKSDIPEYDASQGTWSGPTVIEADFVTYEERLEERVSALEDKVEMLQFENVILANLVEAQQRLIEILEDEQ